MKQSRRKTMPPGVQQPSAIRIRIGQLQWSGGRADSAEALRAALENGLRSGIPQTQAAGQSNLDELPGQAAEAIMARVNTALKQRGKT